MYGSKVCTKCKRELPATPYYFSRDRRSKSGFTSCCKKCYGSDYGVSRTRKIVDRSKQTEGQKICVKCEIEKPLIDFPNDKRSNDGKRPHCLECYKLIQKEWMETNKERYKGYFTEWYRKHPGYRSKVYKNRKEYENETNKKWRINNKEKCRLISAKKRQLKRKLPFNYTIDDWKATLKYFNNSCCYCGCKEELQQDHFIPLSKGGAYIKSNIVPACKSCNSSKRNSSFEDWYIKQQFYSDERKQLILQFIGVKNGVQQLSIL